MSNYYAAPLNPSQRTLSLRAIQYRRARKRKRDDEGEQELFLSDEDNAQTAGDTSTRHSAFHLLSADEATQFRVAGLSPDRELPSAPFPHASAASTKTRITPSHVQRELAELNPPLYVPSALSKADPLDNSRRNGATNLRNNHLNVLTTLMHRCLLKGDYERAGRAWGMLLRSQFNGRPIDLRSHGRWGIGAEILFQKTSQRLSVPTSRSDQNAYEDISESGDTSSAARMFFSREGFKAARDYYERLILHHPSRVSHPHATSSSTFYPAMFGLWIYEICERSRKARHEFERVSARQSSRDSPSDDEDHTSSGHSSSSSNAGSKWRDLEMRLKNEELRQARELVDMLEPLLVSPPLDKNVDLLQIRGMVGLWIADLIAGSNPSAEEAQDREVTDDERDSTEVWAEKRSHNLAVKTEKAKAQEFFRRVEVVGGRLWEGVKHMTISSDPDKDVEAEKSSRADQSHDDPP